MPISNYEDEDFTVEITIPKDMSIDQVEEMCHIECIKDDIIHRLRRLAQIKTSRSMDEVECTEKYSLRNL